MSPGELAVGQIVTVLDTVDDEKETFQETDMFSMVTGRSRPNFAGLPLKVLAIDLPYIVAELNDRKFPLDTRQLRLMELKPEFVAAIAPTPPKPEENDRFGQLVESNNKLVSFLAQNVLPRLAAIEGQQTIADAKPWWKRRSSWKDGAWLVVGLAVYFLFCHFFLHA